MFEKVISFSVRNKLAIVLLLVALIAAGIRSMNRIPLDAVPDITNNQVQVVTVSPTLAAQEVEQFITFPIERNLATVPYVEEIRSISRFGLSVVTVVFEDDLPILEARQYVREQLASLGDAIPSSLGEPELMPITTGLGEIYQYTLSVDPAYKDQYDDMDLRTIQDWIVKRQLAGTKGIVEISSFGGRVKQYEVGVRPASLNQFGITMADVFDALEQNNQNSGGSYIERGDRSFYIRTDGIVRSLDEIRNILIERRDGVPIRIAQVAEVRLGSSVRYGAMTMDGEGEVVGGITLMLKGGNSSDAIKNVHDRIEQVKNSLPEGVNLEPFLDRSILVGKAINTVSKNLIEGGLIVILVLILLLGNLRAGLIVASVIPLAMLFAFVMMDIFGVSANLMSLGAIDFGIVVDGAVIIIEAILHAILLRQLSDEKIKDMDGFVIKQSSDIYRTAAFGILIILVVFVPIMTLTGIEGKMFRPMAQTFSFAILGAFILTLTYVPMISAIVLRNVKVNENGISERIMRAMQRVYQPTLTFVLRRPGWTVAGSLATLLIALLSFLRMGAVFIPTLDEGDLAMQMAVAPGSSLTKSIETASMAERILLKKFPEVKHVVSKIGTAEVPTDPMGIEDADIMIILKERDEWTTTDDREKLIEMMKESLDTLTWASFEFTQPIQLRFNELITGAKTDIAVKIFGEDMDELRTLAAQAESVIQEVRGAADVKVEQTEGLSQYLIEIDRARCAQYGVTAGQVNSVVRAAYAGEKTGVVYEGERRFDLVVRLNPRDRSQFELRRVYVHNDLQEHIPVSEVTRLKEVDGPVQIQREDAKRRITIGVNVRERDVETLVEEIEERLQRDLDLPPGYFITYGGAFENLQSAKQRLMIAVPVALLLILLLLYIAFGNVKDALLIFSAVPLSAVGGVFLLIIRGMPFSISAGVGFIALFGVAVLNGIVLIGYFKKLMEEHPEWTMERLIENGALVRLRPVLMTAMVAMLGFLPMALSTSAGAEVQKPLATVVIGGLITSTLLTLVVLPSIFLLSYKRRMRISQKDIVGIALIMLFAVGSTMAQSPYTKEEAIQDALLQNPDFTTAELRLKQSEAAFRGALDLGETEVGFQYGQINAPGVEDYYIEFKQNFGNPMETVGERGLQKAIIERDIVNVEISRRKIGRDVSTAWIEWQVESKKLEIIKEFRSTFDGLLDKAKERMDVGEIGSLEHKMLVGLSLELDMQYQAQLGKKLRAANRLTRLTSAMINDGRLGAKLEEVDLLESDPALAEVFERLAEMEAHVASSRVKRATRSYFPSLSLGYFSQQIEGTGGLDGVTAGLSIPLWNAPQRSGVRQQRLEEEIVADRTGQMIIASQHDLEVQYARLEALIESVNDPRRVSLAGVERVFDQAMNAYDLGEMSYLEFLQVARTGVDIEMNYWDLRMERLRTFEQVKYYAE